VLASILSVMMRTSKRLKKLAACTKAWTLTLHAALHAYTVLCDMHGGGKGCSPKASHDNMHLLPHWLYKHASLGSERKNSHLVLP